MKIGAKITGFRAPLNRRHNLIADDQTTNIASFSFGNVFLNQDMGIQPPKRINNTFSSLTRLCQYHADPLRAFYQLHDQRRPANHLNKIAGIIRRMGDPGNGKIDPLARQKL
ncbi:Uncharacterised protein [Salmonella enterica subsp. enterica]|nr:Uncharacterised protein [Salmonella enterica subsp. enterica]